MKRFAWLMVLYLFLCRDGLALHTVPNTWVEPITGMLFIEIKAGHFVMGSPLDEVGRELQEQQHEVNIARSFWLGAFEVTQGEWQKVMGNNPSHFRTRGDRFPVEQVSWFDVQEFLRRLGAQSAGNRFRLPTEAEWEYACRAGTMEPYSTGATLTLRDANFSKGMDESTGNAKGTTRVGSFAPNAWGIHDMHGNVWEWTEDEDCPYPSGSVIDVPAQCGSMRKIIRGGSWYFYADSARCALRYTHRPQDRGFSLGFRVVREPAESREDK